MLATAMTNDRSVSARFKRRCLGLADGISRGKLVTRQGPNRSWQALLVKNVE